ncbi:MAG: alpha/beta fold hydrolase [Deltaproteobacteria bacterium]|nr:alpha/beta fold hydrolase [Deltaproteobacteria bacterium]MBI3390009.1 alpha/beta fold hydrolase [Deltaproteobacteria bacterium]
MPYVDANRIHTYYEHHGDGPPAVLLHGAAMVAEGWGPQIGAFSKHFTVYVPERRGVGRSADIDRPWTYFEMARDTAAFMDTLKIREAAVIGLSDGGNIGLILAYSRPDLVRKLVVSGANSSADGLGPFKDEVAQMTPEALLATAPPQVQPWIEVHRRVSPDRGADLVRSFAKMRRMWLDYEIPVASLAAIAVPTLVMAGDQDLIPVTHTVEIWSAIPGAQLCIAPGASHFWLQEMSALANGLILDFLLKRVA